MQAILKDNTWLYQAEDYSFTLTDEAMHNHVTTIIKPAHIRIISKSPEQTLSTADLKEQIISDWFLIDNDNTRTRNNQKRRNKRNGL